MGKAPTANLQELPLPVRGQYLDTGSKVIHNAPNTTSNINSKSISKDGGVCIYRGSVVIGEKAEGAKSNVSCESLYAG